MSQRYFKVLYTAGAYIGDFHYGLDEIVPYNPKPGEKVYWGQEVNAQGEPVGDQKTGHELQDKMAASFGAKGAESTTAPAAPATQPTPPATPPAEDKTGEANGVPADKAAQIVEALGLLDPANAEHWTIKGQPNVEVVEGILGFKTSRAELDAVKPGFVRPK